MTIKHVVISILLFELYLNKLLPEVSKTTDINSFFLIIIFSMNIEN